jgi:hypothetical protein
MRTGGFPYTDACETGFCPGHHADSHLKRFPCKDVDRARPRAVQTGFLGRREKMPQAYAGSQSLFSVERACEHMGKTGANI